MKVVVGLSLKRTSIRGKGYLPSAFVTVQYYRHSIYWHVLYRHMFITICYLAKYLSPCTYLYEFSLLSISPTIFRY